MLPLNAENSTLHDSSREKLDNYFRRFCEGDRGRQYGIGHIVYACHASFPLLLSPALANLIWLNFKTFTVSKNAEDTPGIQSIDPVAVSDFLLSPLVRPVSAGQYEVIPDIRNYLLHMLKDGSWFSLYGISGFGSNRLYTLARFLQQYLDDKRSQAEPAGLVQVNRWAAMAYLEPDSLALSMSQAFRSTIDGKNELGQLRLNLLMDRFGDQYNMNIRDDATQTKSFINLHVYSKANHAQLFEKGADVVSDILAELDEDFIGGKSSDTTIVELPVEKAIGKRLERKKNKIQRIVSLLIGIDQYADSSIKLLKGCEFGAKQGHMLLQNLDQEQFETRSSTLLTGKEATRQKIIDAIEELYASTNSEDTCLIYFAGHGINDSYEENLIIPYDYHLHDSTVNAGISNKEFEELIKRFNWKKCQTVFILSSNTGFYRWLSEDDIFIGAVRHTARKITSTSFTGNSIFSSLLLRIIEKNGVKITYRDLHLWINHIMENDYDKLNENPVLITNNRNLEKLFLTNNYATAKDYSLIAFSKRTNAWQLITEDFMLPVMNSRVDIYEYASGLQSESVVGKLSARLGTIVFADEINRVPVNLHKEKLYRGYSRHLLTCTTPYPEGSDEVSRNKMTKLNTKRGLKKWGKGYNEVSRNEMTNRLESIRFGTFSSWSGLFVQKHQDEALHYHGTLFISMDELKQDEFGLLFRIKNDDKTVVLLDWIVAGADALVDSIIKFSRYHYMFQLSGQPQTYLPYKELQAHTTFSWIKETTAVQITGQELKLDNSCFRTGNGQISFYPLQIQLYNEESFPLFYDVYLIISDFTIKKITGNGINWIDSDTTAKTTMNEPLLLDKILSSNYQAHIKIMLSRDPLQYDFSQAGIHQSNDPL